MINPRRYYHRTHQIEQEEAQREREHMFEKSLTPSDVGKLSRLVIPKQYAEKYFPGLDGASGEKGLLLSFQDESGKPWQFRYSYWTSSQSYVLTKGWSHFVKEKRLDASDVVFFGRLRGGGDRLYINCRRCSENESPQVARAATMADAALPGSHTATTSSTTSSRLYLNSLQQESLTHAGDVANRKAITPAASKRLRLFGVNLDCVPEPEPEPALVLAPETETGPVHTRL